MINIFVISWIMFIHFVFDFILQSDEDAKNKSKSNEHLWSHVSTYQVGICIAGLGIWHFDNSFQLFYWWIVNLIAHFVTDYFTSRGSSHFFQKQDTHNGFVVIGFDQYIHLITLLGTYLLFK